MKHILAIDQSTSATKALIYDVAGRLVDKSSKEHQQIYPQPGWVEHDAEQIWRNTLEVLTSVLQRNDSISNELACLSITNQRETVVVFDRATGQPLHNAIVWQCRRGDPICSDLLEQGRDDQVRRKTGLRIDTYFPASKLKWLMANRSDIARKVEDGSALIGTIDAYLIYRLTRGSVFASDPTNASRTLLFDIRRNAWDGDLCAMFGVPEHALPEVRGNDASFGEAAFGSADLASIPGKPLPIFGVMGDSQASLFAQRCFEPGMAKVTLGTGSSVLLNIGNELRMTDSGAVSSLAWRIGEQTTFAFEGLINYSAATIEWLRSQLGLIQNADETETLARSVEDNGGVYLVPAFAGLSAPYWSRTARAAILGMTAHSTKAHVVRAALESIAYQIRDVLEMMEKDASVPLQSIQADGGAARNKFLVQFIADIVGRPLNVAQTPDFSPLGAALSGALGMGLYDSLEDLSNLEFAATMYRPTMPGERVEHYYTGWKRAVSRLL